MKIIAITIFILFGVTTLILCMDLLLGIGFSNSIFNTIRPFRVMDATEIFVILLFTVIFFVQNIIYSIKRKKEKTGS